jgi:outer membrane protein assembly factor BamB
MWTEHGAVPEGRRCRVFVAVLWVAGMLFAAGSCGKSVGYEVGGGMSAVGTPQWAMFGATPQRNGRSVFEGPRLGQHHSVFLAEEGVDDAEVLVEAVGPRGDVFVLVRRELSGGQLVSLDPDGEERWRFPAGETMGVGGVALGGVGDLYLSGMQLVPGTDLASPQVNLFFKLGVDGFIEWTWHPAESVGNTIVGKQGSPVYDGDGVSYAIHSNLYDPALDSRASSLNAYGPDGALLWQWERPLGPEPIPPALGPDGNLHMMIDSEWFDIDPMDERQYVLYVLNAQGEELRVLQMTDQSVSTVSTLAVGDDGTLYVAARDGVGPLVMAIDPDGGIAWTCHLPADEFSSIETTIAISAESTLWVGAKAESGPQDNLGALVAISPDGDLLWSVDTVGVPCGGLAVDNTGAVYALTVDSDRDSVVVGVESDGELRLSVEIEGDQRSCRFFDSDFFVSSVVLADGGRLYFGSADGTFHRVE